MTTRSRESPSPSDPVAEEALASLFRRAERMERELRRLLAAKLDQKKLRWRRLLARAAAGAVGAVVVLGALLMGVWCLVRGLAGAVAMLAPAHPWVGDAAAGVLVLGGLTGGAALAWRAWSRAGLHRAILKYGNGSAAAQNGAGDGGPADEQNHV